MVRFAARPWAPCASCWSWLSKCKVSLRAFAQDKLKAEHRELLRRVALVHSPVKVMAYIKVSRSLLASWNEAAISLRLSARLSLWYPSSIHLQPHAFDAFVGPTSCVCEVGAGNRYLVRWRQQPVSHSWHA